MCGKLFFFFFPPALLNCNWQKTLRTICWFATFIYSEHLHNTSLNCTGQIICSFSLISAYYSTTQSKTDWIHGCRITGRESQLQNYKHIFDGTGVIALIPVLFEDQRYFKMITVTTLANTSILLYNYHFFLCDENI